MDKLKKHCPVILGNNVRLRLLQRADIEILRRWRNSDRDKFIYSKLISPEDQKKWFEGYQEKENDLLFIIEKLNRKPIGAVSLYRIDLSSMRAEFGRMMIGDIKSRKKGFARDASESLIRFAFSTLNLRQLRLEVLKNNKPAIRFYEKIGFQRTSVKGDHAADVVAMILDRDTYFDSLRINRKPN